MVNENSKAWQAVAKDLVFGETITVMDQLPLERLHPFHRLRWLIYQELAF
jgi:hypothetical protein